MQPLRVSSKTPGNVNGFCVVTIFGYRQPHSNVRHGLKPTRSDLSENLDPCGDLQKIHAYGALRRTFTR